MKLSPLFEKLENKDPALNEIFPNGMANPQRPTRARTAQIGTDELKALFLSEHQRLNLAPPHSQALDALQSQPVFVLTGQQAVFAGGPLIIWEKAKTCLELARAWRKQGQNALAVFWIAGDDTDHEEVFHFEWTENSIPIPRPDVPKSSMISTWTMDQQWCDQIKLWQEQVGFPIDLLNFYQAGQSWVSAFAKIIQSWFGDDLLIIDAASPFLSKHKQAVLQKLLQEQDHVGSLLLEREKVLNELGIKVQVPHLGGARVFELSNGQRQRPLDVNSALDLSHDALSRPLVVDTLFPIGVHVLGPGELNYFAQISPLYQWLGLEFPQIAPRMHATLDRPKDLLFFKQLGTSITEMRGYGPGRFSQWFFHKHAPETWHQGWWSWTIPDTDPLLVQSQKRLSLQIDNLIVKEKKKLARKYTQSKSEIWQEFLNFWQWNGSGRKQERVLSFWEAQKNGADQILFSLDPLCTDHQGMTHDNC